MVGDFFNKSIRNIGDGNAAGGRSFDIDTVDTDAAERDDLAAFQTVDDRLRHPDALGIDGIGSLGRRDKAGFIRRSLDDLRAERDQRFAFQCVAAAGDRETCTGRRNNFEFSHSLFLQTRSALHTETKLATAKPRGQRVAPWLCNP